MRSQDIEKFERYLRIAQRTIHHEPDSIHFHTVLTDKCLEEFIKPLDLPLESVILDVGCGSGYWSYKMKESGYTNITGVTLNDQDIEECDKRGITTIKADMTFMDVDDCSIDFLFCRHVIEHSPFPILTLMEFNRVLKKDSRIYIEVPAPDTDRKHEENPNHYSILGGKMWAELFTRAGFDIEWSKEFNCMVQNRLTDDIIVDQNERFYHFMLIKRVGIEDQDTGELL